MIFLIKLIYLNGLPLHDNNLVSYFSFLVLILLLYLYLNYIDQV
jgi:hypothetical protein